VISTDPYMLEDLSIITDDELTEDQWFEVARREFFQIMVSPPSGQRCGYTIGNQCLCGRKAYHVGPHVGLELTLTTLERTDSQGLRTLPHFSMDVKRTYPVPQYPLNDDRVIVSLTFPLYLDPVQKEPSWTMPTWARKTSLVGDK
jgi:hypothetical protein